MRASKDRHVQEGQAQMVNTLTHSLTHPFIRSHIHTNIVDMSNTQKTPAILLDNCSSDRDLGNMYIQCLVS